MDNRSLIQMILQKEPNLTIQEMADRIGISKMAVFKHIEFLEHEGIVERKIEKGNVGRPFYRFSLSEENDTQISNNDSVFLQALLDYLIESGNETLLNRFLRDRQKKFLSIYREKLGHLTGDERIMKLASLRKADHYYPEVHKNNDSTTELLELNCPIFRVAKKNGVACSLENEMFEILLDSHIEATHKKIDGMGACRFLIHSRERPSV